MIKTLDHIPTSKVSRATKLIATGAKIGFNYLNYYKDKITGQETEYEARQKLHENNATDIYDSLADLKGSALKVAQMLSMDRNLLPRQYVEKFSLSQFSVPPLSAPLVNRTFQKYFGKLPTELFDKFQAEAVKAASIGQVHIAWKDGKKLAVKIQYPGVAESVSSDLKLVKPIAIRMFNMQGRDSDKYFQEVENKLLEETDYNLELRQSIEVASKCAHIPDLKFPQYYPLWSNEKIITMDFMEGKHLSEFAKLNTDKKLANKLGQALWNFFMYQIHHLKKVHADPHPGNFLITPDKKLAAIDFGCMKSIPDSFYCPYFQLRDEDILKSQERFHEKMQELELIKSTDTLEEIDFFTDLFHDMISVFMTPMIEDTFDFSDAGFFEKLFQMAERFHTDTRMKDMNGNRGSKHFIYINRTFFGLYSMLHDLKSTQVKIDPYGDFQ